MTTAVADRLHPLRVLREALAVYREHWRILVGAAFVIFAPLALLDGLLGQHDADAAVGRLLVAVAGTVLHLLGDVLYAGLVATAVIAWRSGAARQSPLEVARALPWGTIVVLDLLLAFGTAFLLVALVIPGIAFYTYFSLAPAVAKIDHVGVREAMRRSARMVRGSFWRVFAVLLIVTGGAGVVEEVLQAGLHAFAGDVAAHLLVQTLTVPVYGLATVLMAFHLRPAGQ